MHWKSYVVDVFVILSFKSNLYAACFRDASYLGRLSLPMCVILYYQRHDFTHICTQNAF